MSSTLTNLTAATTWSGTDLFYALVGGNSRKIAASSLWTCDAANVLSDVNSTNAQTVRVYRTFTDSSNYERLALMSSAATMEITAETAGTGSDDLWIKLTAPGIGFIYSEQGFRCSASSTNAGIGYYGGAGAAVTQLTSKSTSVTINKLAGAITTHNAALAAGATVKFTVNCNLIGSADVVVLNYVTGGTAGAYRIDNAGVTGGASFDVNITNITGGSLSEAFSINYVIIRGALS